MTHLELENLTSDYLEGLLESALKAEVESHLSVCPTCLEMVGDVRRALELCHDAPELEPSPWLVRKIMLATVGQRKPGWAERLVASIRPLLQLRVAYGVAMAVFSFSIIINAAGINLRHMTFEDLNPRTWFFRGKRAWYLNAARVEKFIYDAKVVYEIESRLRQLHSHSEEEQEAPKQEPPPGGSTNSAPALPALATNRPGVEELAGHAGALRNEIAPLAVAIEAVRSQKP
ncbi:MAG TPA: zf-HC2 domain-containing protein [Terriglobia bacterium]|nr:zf-HC2 domain-containing protein [Terriglobia bacterium]